MARASGEKEARVPEEYDPKGKNEEMKMIEETFCGKRRRKGVKGEQKRQSRTNTRHQPSPDSLSDLPLLQPGFSQRFSQTRNFPVRISTVHAPSSLSQPFPPPPTRFRSPPSPRRSYCPLYCLAFASNPRSPLLLSCVDYLIYVSEQLSFNLQLSLL